MEYMIKNHLDFPLMYYFIFKIKELVSSIELKTQRFSPEGFYKLYLKLLPFNKKLNNDILNEEAFKAYPYEVKFEKKLRHLKK